MSNVPLKSPALTPLPFVVILALVAATACGERPESDPDPLPPAVPEQQAFNAETTREAETPALESTEEAGEHGEGVEEGEHRGGGEHEGDREGGEHGQGGEHGEEGEESGEYIPRTQTWDAARRGIRLTLSYDEAQSAFTGMVENTTEATICNVRVEVHLDDGTELGPTEGLHLRPGESAATRLPSGGESFERWTAHPESSQCDAG